MSRTAVQKRRQAAAKSEGQFEAELGGEGNTDGGAGAEEIAESAGRDTELFVAGDRRGLGAGGVEEKRGGVAEIVDRSRKRGDDASEGSAAELVERSLHAVDDRAIVAGEAVVGNVGGSGDGEGASAFELGERGCFEMPGELQRAD